jgi:hypothetical protein
MTDESDPVRWMRLHIELKAEIAQLHDENAWLRKLLADIIRDPRKAKRLQSAAGEIMDFINAELQKPTAPS